MKAVLLGGGGFLGSYIAEHLLANGQTVCILARKNSPYLEHVRHLGAKIIFGNFLDADTLATVVADCDIVYHLISATNPQTSNENPRYDVEANLLGTLQLLEHMRKVGIKKIIFASSGGTIYGIPDKTPISEGHHTNPVNSYGIIKLAIEKYLHLFWHLYGINYCILRISNVYGIRQPVTNSQGVVASFLDKAIKGEELVVWGDGTALRDYIYISDVASVFFKASLYHGEPRIFNIGSGKAHSVNDIINILQKKFSGSLRVKYLPKRPFDVPVNILDVSCAKRHLNWEPKVTFEEGILFTFEWMKKNHSTNFFCRSPGI